MDTFHNPVIEIMNLAEDWKNAKTRKQNIITRGALYDAVAKLYGATFQKPTQGVENVSDLPACDLPKS